MSALGELVQVAVAGALTGLVLWDNARAVRRVREATDRARAYVSAEIDRAAAGNREVLQRLAQVTATLDERRRALEHRELELAMREANLRVPREVQRN